MESSSVQRFRRHTPQPVVHEKMVRRSAGETLGYTLNTKRKKGGEMDSELKLFIGSASESLDVANALEYELQNVARTEVWDRSFRPGHYTLEELTRKAGEVDFAAFILGQDDTTDSRGAVALSPRDNVVYEAGLFAGHLGVSRVFLLVDARGTKIPTDWKGLGYVTFDIGAGGEPDVRQAAVKIRKELSDWKRNEASAPNQRITGYWWQFVVNRIEGSVLSLMQIAPPDRDSDWTVRGRAWTGEGKQIAVYSSRAVALDEEDLRLFYYWDGKYPFDESIPTFFGVGEIQFADGGNDGPTTAAEGWYSESPLVDLDATVRKSTIYLRATDEEIQVLNGHDETSIRSVVTRRVDEWKQKNG